jgi:outer membrane protein
MSRSQWTLATMVLGMAITSATADAQLLTVDRAVEIGRERSSLSVAGKAGVVDAQAGLFGAYSGVLPRFSANISRSGQWTDNRSGTEQFGGVTLPSLTFDAEDYSTNPGLNGSWAVLDLSAMSNFSAARNNLRAARQRETATRSDLTFQVRAQFYEVVRAVQLARVNAEAVRLARDDERRVRALFEVGSVSKSDLLAAQVRTAQSELDSITARHAITTTRNDLAILIGMEAAEMDEVDTVLAFVRQEYDESQILAEAERDRPDIQAAESDMVAAGAAVNAARFQYLPYVTVSGSAAFSPKSTSALTINDTTTVSRNETDQVLRGTVALNWDFFDGLATEAQRAQAKARQMRARDTRDALRRNLAADVRESLLLYQEATEALRLAERALESAVENNNLNQQKYNVGSSTILELINAQLQLQQASSQRVTALAVIKVAEARIERVRGR